MFVSMNHFYALEPGMGTALVDDLSNKKNTQKRFMS